MNAETQHFRKKMTELNRMMKEQNLPYSLRSRMRSFFLQNRYQALYVTRQKLRECMSPQLQSEICTAVNAPWIQKVSFFNTFMDVVQTSEAAGEDVDAHRACIADVSQQLECGAFAQGERFDNVQVLYIVSKGIVALNSRVGTNGAVWGEDFVLQDTELIRPIKGCALTYLEVLFLTRDVFMKVIERRRKTCPLLGQIVRKFCIRLAVRRAFVAEANRRAGLDPGVKRQGAILVRKSVIPAPVTIPPPQARFLLSFQSFSILSSLLGDSTTSYASWFPARGLLRAGKPCVTHTRRYKSFLMAGNVGRRIIRMIRMLNIA